MIWILKFLAECGLDTVTAVSYEPRGCVVLKGSTNVSDLTLHGKAQAHRCRSAIQRIPFDRYVQWKKNCFPFAYLRRRAYYILVSAVASLPTGVFD